MIFIENKTLVELTSLVRIHCGITKKRFNVNDALEPKVERS